MLPPDLVAPPSWSLTVGLIGRVLILMASGLFGLSCISWIFSRRRKRNSVKKQRDKKRRKLVKKLAVKRAKLKAAVRNLDLSAEERFEAMLKLAEMPRNSAKIRIRNRCQLTGRPRGNFRKFSLSRIALRDLAAKGQLPGVTKSSW